MPTTEGYLTTGDGIRLFYRMIGDGPQTVLIPNGLYFASDFAPLANGRRLIFYDLRNRGQSDTVTDPAKLAAGVHNDVEDLEAVRRHFSVAKADLMAHSYVAAVIALYAMKYPDSVRSIVQIAPTPPEYDKQYPPDLMNNDGLLPQVFAKLGQIPRDGDPAEVCRRFWETLRAIYVADPANAAKLDWGRCELPNERNFMMYFNGSILPSLRAAKVASFQTPSLIVHGRKDRNAAYGGALDWAKLLPKARLLTLENAAHAPWIEDPEPVFAAIDEFLSRP